MRKLTHEEVAGKRLSLSDLQTAQRTPIIGLLDNIRSLYNVGSMFRTSDGARIRQLILCGYTPRPPRKEIEKTSLGATASVPWEYFADPDEAVQTLRRTEVTLCALEQTTASIPYHDLTREDFPVCLIVGNEITGVSQKLIEAADRAIEIPMYGVKQSLNAAVAYGIALFELVRIWHSR